MNISQSLIKMVREPDHCPKQIYYSFIEGKELLEPSDNMLMGRYFESELLGACRGGEKQEAKYSQVNLKPSSGSNKPVIERFLLDKGIDITECKNLNDLKQKLKFVPSEYVNGEKLSAYQECDDLVIFARGIMSQLGISEGKPQVDITYNGLSAAIDYVSNDINDTSNQANYDVKWTATQPDDRWNGWGDPESKEDAIIQAAHYSLVTKEKTGEWIPFYFLVFGKSKWVKVIRYSFTPESIEFHKQRISNTAATIKEYAMNEYKGKGGFNKCFKCPFKEECTDKVLIPEIEKIII